MWSRQLTAICSCVLFPESSNASRNKYGNDYGFAASLQSIPETRPACTIRCSPFISTTKSSGRYHSWISIDLRLGSQY
ncbi:hypothetical protein BJ508DRAFT_13397 [Ascobolus immersus RN42]|uniref:Uncharacterized protein n=1 Tax=Ascobolus immersus RN42 TaxID=1160509 RepID=A0A3N4IU51_ASCIM|nr:hypothetical protein BJ508DRAFT_13397 [Ascobolus immersus RN42]